MNIFCIDYPYAKSLEALGHTVLAVEFAPGLAYLPGILRLHGFRPDLVIQYESLAARVLLDGLEEMPCPTLFVSVDSHLNMFWHKYYARLFDLVLTPHISIFNSLPAGERLPTVRRFGPVGYERMFRDFDLRGHDLAFVGVLTEHRPARAEMARLLSERSGLYIPDKRLAHAEMLDLFTDSRMAPNESIAREVNFRLFEAASCGSLVFCQPVGEDQNVHFEPGREFEIYEHSLELVEKIAFYKKNRSAAAAIGRAAWERVRAEHLPEHRARQLAQSVNAVRNRAEGAEAAIFLWLTLAQMARNGTHPFSVEWLMSRQEHEDENGLAAGMKLRLLMEGSQQGNPLYSREQAERYRFEAVEMIRFWLRSGRYAAALECNLAGAMAALVLRRPSWARSFWRRQMQNIQGSGPDEAFVGYEKLDMPYAHYLAWARLLLLRGLYAQRGFNFSAEKGYLPGSAFECLLMARDAASSGQDGWLGEMQRLCSRIPGFGYLDMGFLAEMSLRQPKNWRHQMEYGLSSLVNYRLEAGLFELFEARDKAQTAGEIRSFNAKLEDAPSSGYILSALMRG